MTSEEEKPEATEKKPYKRRFGDRADGRRVRSIPPMNRIESYILKTRNTSSNYFRSSLEMTAVDRYVQEKRAAGRKGFSVMHVLLAAYIRTVSQMPQLNRFIAGQETYARSDISIAIAIKKEMALESPETVVKVTYEPTDTADAVYDRLTKVIDGYRSAPGGDFDDTAKVLSYLPGLLIRFAIDTLRLMDYFGIMPKFLTDISPFHCSFFITSMGSLGIPPIYHHLYDFGNVPMFLSFGAKRHQYEVQADGSVKNKAYVDFTIVTDERICDGYYYAAAFKTLLKYCKNPWLLDTPPETVFEDLP